MLLGPLVFCAIFADFLAPYSYQDQHREHPYAPPVEFRFGGDGGRWPPFVYATHMTDFERRSYSEDRSRMFPIRFFVEGESYRLFGIVPSRTHLFGVDLPGRIFLLGTDALGRDIFSRLLYGARRSLAIAAVALLISFPLALAAGCLTGFYGGRIDFAGMRLIELFLALPAIYLIVALRSALPLSAEPEEVFLALIAVIALFGWATTARIIRGMVLSLRQREFVTAARALGASDLRIIARHILPHLSGFALVQASLAAPGFILAEVTLSYLGLGVQEPLPSWGNMLADAAHGPGLMATYWWNLAPVAAIFITSFAFHLVADGLKDLFDPRTKSVESMDDLL
jgi:peptide/nickel transport system permease protein